jgi:hypothetical protein
MIPAAQMYQRSKLFGTIGAALLSVEMLMSAAVAEGKTTIEYSIVGQGISARHLIRELMKFGYTCSYPFNNTRIIKVSCKPLPKTTP